MKRLIPFFLYLALLIIPSIVQAMEQTVTFFIDNMDCCGSLESRLGEILEGLYGVVDYTVEASSQTITVIFDDKLMSLDELVAALRKEGLNPEKP